MAFPKRLRRKTRSAESEWSAQAQGAVCHVVQIYPECRADRLWDIREKMAGCAAVDSVYTKLMTKSFSGISPASFAALTAFLKSEGIAVPDGNSGTISITSPAAIQLTFTYDGTNTLDLTIDQKPFFVAESMIWSKIESGLAKAV